MERNGNSEFQLMKLKVASEIVRSSQAAVAFSRAFYLEEVLIDKIGKELKDLKEQVEGQQNSVNELIKSVELEDNIVTESSIRIICSTIQSELDGKFETFEDLQKRILQAEARRQAKSCLLEKLSTNELMSKFESLTLTELRELQVPEFSCFINESDFGLLEGLNEDWNLFRKEVMSLIQMNANQLELLRLDDHASTYREINSDYNNHMPNVYKGQTFHTGSEVPAEEIGKAFANRSGNVIRRFATLLTRGKRNKKTLSLSTGSYGEF